MAVIPAQAGIQSFQTHLDPGLRRGDGAKQHLHLKSMALLQKSPTITLQFGAGCGVGGIYNDCGADYSRLMRFVPHRILWLFHSRLKDLRQILGTAQQLHLAPDHETPFQDIGRWLSNMKLVRIRQDRRQPGRLELLQLLR